VEYNPPPPHLKNFPVSADKKLMIIRLKWNRAFFEFSLIIEGTTEKVLQFIMPLELIYSRNFGFIEQKMYF
jgi:hypothetical protein